MTKEQPNLIDDRYDWQISMEAKSMGIKLGKTYVEEGMVAEFVIYIQRRYAKVGFLIGLLTGLILTVIIGVIVRMFS